MPFKNKEEKRAYDKAYRAKNRESRLAYAKKYREANKDRVNAQKREWAEAKKDGLIRVYMLTGGYVGVTNSLYNRMRQHRNSYNRDASNYIVLHECETREQALRLESVYHSLGFKGANQWNLKNKKQ
jgi:hypothetical protein